ncbi:hypothetical protein GEMRC1_012649 [Eukaryota sp. GEM-RC1]
MQDELNELYNTLENSLTRSEQLLSSTANMIFDSTDKTQCIVSLQSALNSARQNRSTILSTLKHLIDGLQSTELNLAASPASDLESSVLLKLQDTLTAKLSESVSDDKVHNQLKTDLQRVKKELNSRNLYDCSIDSFIDRVEESVDNVVNIDHEFDSLLADDDSLCQTLIIPETPMVRPNDDRSKPKSTPLHPSTLHSLMSSLLE